MTTVPPSTWKETSKLDAAFSPKFVMETITDSLFVKVPLTGESTLTTPISSANKTSDVNKEPAPFVLQTSLDDFYISYQINAYTNKSEKAAIIYSELHGHIIDEFNEANVEILSPHYRAARDGNMATIPPEHLPPEYNAPGFNVNLKNEK